MEVVVKYKPNKTSKSAEFRINHRIIQEYGFQEAKKIGALDSILEEKQKNKHFKKKKKKINKQKKQKSQKTGSRTGIEYQQKYQEFIKNGGDPNSCPFD